MLDSSSDDQFKNAEGIETMIANVVKKGVKTAFTKVGLQITTARSKELINLPEEISLYQRYYPADSIKNRKFFNLGAGGFRHPFWTNIDKLNDFYRHMQDDETVIDYDFFSMKELPIASESAEVVFSSHAIEHVPDEQVKFLFKEIHRILKPGAGFRVTCPDIDLDYRSYINKDLDFFYFRFSPWENKNPTCDSSVREMSMEQTFIWHIAGNASIHHVDGCANRITDEEFREILSNNSKEDALNQIVGRADREIHLKYPCNHINWFNFDKLKSLLSEAGFNTVFREAYGQSQIPVLRNTKLFDNTHPKISLYVEAFK